MAYFNNKAKIDKAIHHKTAYKIQLYNNNKVDELVKTFNNAGESSKTSKAVLTAELSILNKPEVYKNYNRIINSKFTSNDNFFKMLVRNKAQTSLDNIVKSEVGRISKNLDYVEKVLQTYEIPTKQYQKLVNQQAEKSLANRRQILEQVAIKNNDLLVSEGLNIPSNVYSYRDLELTAQSLLRESQMTASFEEAQSINQHYLDNGKDAIYNSKVWIHTYGGKTTRHMSNHMQRVRFDEPFIVVNDSTLEIDEMMHPCDPAGSASNAFVCYCEVEYENDGELESDTINLNQSVFDVAKPEILSPTPEVTFSDTVASLKDKMPTLTSLSQFLQNNKVAEYIKNNPVETVPKNINVETLESAMLPNEYLLPKDFKAENIDVVGYEHNSKGEIVPVVTGEAISEYNSKMSNNKTIGDKIESLTETKIDNTLTNEIPKNTGEVINIENYTKGTDGILINADDGLVLNKTTGHYELNGLEIPVKNSVVDEVYYNPEADIGKISLKAIEEHNKKLGVVEPKSEIIKVEDLLYNETENNYTVTKHEGLITDNLTGKSYLNGLDVTEYMGITGKVAYIPAEKIIEHNLDLGEPTFTKPVNKEVLTPKNENKKQYIDTNMLEELDHESWHIPTHKAEIKADLSFNELTGHWEYKGLTIEGSKKDSPVGWIDKVDVVAHNESLGFKPAGEVIEIDNLLVKDKGKKIYIADYKNIKLNEATGKYEYKGLELDTFNGSFGKVKKAKFEAHNAKYGEVTPTTDVTGSGIVRNKYINLMDKNLKPIKEAGEIYIEDLNTGKKYLYDERAVYERKQDDVQNKVDYGVNETNSTTHWGRYGHQILNGLIYRIEKYGYHVYAEQLDLALPSINRLRKLHKDNFKGLDGNGRPVYKNQNKINKEIDKLGEIIDKVTYKEGCSASKTEIKNAMWEMVYMDKAMIESPALLQDTFLVRFGHFDEAMCEVGKTVKLDGYTSTTYESGSASHFEDKMADNPNRWAILIMADEGTSGIRLNSQFNALTTEREWLLARDQEFDVVEFNVNERTVVLKAKPHKLYN